MWERGRETETESGIGGISSGFCARLVQLYLTHDSGFVVGLREHLILLDLVGALGPRSCGVASHSPE